MLALLKVKKNIEFNQRLGSILEVLKSIAVSQFHILEGKLSVFEPFGKVLESFFSLVDMNKVKHPFMEARQDTPVGVIAITTDQGLLGGLNNRVMNAAIHILNSRGGELIVLGEQGKTYARYAKIPFSGFPGIVDDARQRQALELRDYIFEKLGEGRFGAVQVVHPRSLSLINHRLEEVTLLPMSRPEKEKTEKSENEVDTSQMIFESSLEGILEYLSYLWVGQKLSDIFGLSRLAELGARYMHLEESTQRIQEVNKKLKRQYFRCRHEMIDQSMRELFSARALYAEEQQS
jgi:ATP synthase F1 gamma subunit